jgi:transcriptional regulator with XRE-family HTH domain
MNNKNEFGRLCRMYRVKQTLNQVDVAKAVGFSQSYISNVETGKIDPPWDYLVKSMELYAITADWERLQFVSCAFSCSRRIEFPLEDVTILPGSVITKLLSCLALNIDQQFGMDSPGHVAQIAIAFLKNEIKKREEQSEMFNRPFKF